MDDREFSDLIARAGGGDRVATEDLIRRFEPEIRREVRFELLDNQLRRVLDESDVCQSVVTRFFVGLWAGEFELAGPEKLVALLKTMVRNRVADHGRYWSAGRRDLKRVSTPDPESPIDHKAPGESPSRIVADADLLAEAERRLSAEDRSIIDLRRQGKTWPQVASSLQLPSGDAVRMRHERSMARLRSELGLIED